MDFKIVKAPDECLNITDIRTGIDQIDREIITLIRKRSEYVDAAVKFKSSGKNVKADDRVSSLLQQRRVWAEELEIDADIIEDIFSTLVNYFINRELGKWRKESN